jgi:uncharacterized membrane protein YhaH (DUF805 family)
MVLWNAIIGTVFGLLAYIAMRNYNGTFLLIVLIIYAVYMLARFIPDFSLSVRRLHDIGKRWFWLWLILWPVVAYGILWIIAIAKAGSAVSSVFGYDYYSPGIYDLFSVVSGMATFFSDLVVAFIIILIAEFVTFVVWIVFMALPTSPNAIGISTHGDDGYGYGAGNGYGGGNGYANGNGGYGQGSGYVGQYISDANISGVAGMYAGTSFPLNDGEELVIGRDAALAHIVISANGEKISRQHCTISFDPSGQTYLVTDYSSNGTYMNNGSRLNQRTPTRIQRGSVIYLSNQSNSFRLN